MTLPPPVRSKQDMYRRLAAGEFGNTLPLFFSLNAWKQSACPNYGLWGIRSGLGAGDKRMRLNVPTDQVEPLYQEWYPSGGGNISPMLDKWAVLRGEVFERDYGEPFGLSLFYVPPGRVDPDDPWRGSFRKYGKTANGVSALSILQAYLWPSDLEDLIVLLEHYPGHVLEFSACDRAVGIIPSRNTVWWECRNY